MTVKAQAEPHDARVVEVPRSLLSSRIIFRVVANLTAERAFATIYSASPGFV